VRCIDHGLAGRFGDARADGEVSPSKRGVPKASPVVLEVSLLLVERSARLADVAALEFSVDAGQDFVDGVIAFVEGLEPLRDELRRVDVHERIGDLRESLGKVVAVGHLVPGSHRGLGDQRADDEAPHLGSRIMHDQDREIAARSSQRSHVLHHPMKHPLRTLVGRG